MQSEGFLLLVMILTGKTLHRDRNTYKVIFIECLHRFQHWDELFACIPSFPFLGETEPSSPRLVEAVWENRGQGQRSCILALSSPLTAVHTHWDSLSSYTHFHMGKAKVIHVGEYQSYCIFL